MLLSVGLLLIWSLLLSYHLKYDSSALFEMSNFTTVVSWEISHEKLTKGVPLALFIYIYIYLTAYGILFISGMKAQL